MHFPSPLTITHTHAHTHTHTRTHADVRVWFEGKDYRVNDGLPHIVINTTRRIDNDYIVVSATGAADETGYRNMTVLSASLINMYILQVLNFSCFHTHIPVQKWNIMWNGNGNNSWSVVIPSDIDILTTLTLTLRLRNDDDDVIELKKNHDTATYTTGQFR